MKLFSLILLLSCLAVAMGAVNLRAEKAEELSQRIVKEPKAKSVELGAQLNAAYDAALSVRNLVTSQRDISAWDDFYLAMFWMLNTISVVLNVPGVVDVLFLVFLLIILQINA